MIARPATGRRAEVRRESVTLPSAGTTAVAAGMRRQREVRVGLGADAEAPRPDGAAFKLVAPATQPADPTTLWSAAEDGQEAELAATATPPWEPFAFRIGGAGGKLEGTVFNCVVVLREPQERIGAAQTRPATRPATLPISEP